MAKGFIAITKHNSGSEGDYTHRKTYDEAVDVVHKHFIDYDCELKDGKPYSAGNDDGKDGGFACFSDVIMHNGKVAQFTHCDGDGPVGEIRKSK